MQRLSIYILNGQRALSMRQILYGVNSIETGEKLDEITAKYGLELHTEKNNMKPERQLPGQFGVDCVIEGGFIYEDGSFQCKGSKKLNEYGEISFQLNSMKKGRFCDTLPIFGETENITEWQYTAADGETVLLVSGGSEALILADFEGCFVALTIENGSGSITKEVLQELADQIEFCVLEDALADKQNQGLHLAEGDKVSLSGLRSSPEARAFAEWNDFLAGCGMGLETESGNSVFIAEGREDWSLYAVYSYEMGEKLDEIADKYGLKLHTEMNIVSPEELEYRVGGNFMKDCTKYWGYIYEDGTFSFEGDAELGGCGKIDFQFRRSVKGSFGNVMLNIGQMQEYKEWQYLSVSGEPVLLALGAFKALIFADFENCFISVNALLGSEMGMTKEDLQELADKIDFAVLKDVKIPDMRGDSMASGIDAEIQVLVSGTIGGLGMGYLACALPDAEDEDYKLCFFRAENGSEKIAGSLSEMDFNLEAADYIFPDVRKDNAPIGHFLDIYFCDVVQIRNADKNELIIIARYEMDGKIYYDTRAYVRNENVYRVDEEMMQELNGKYRNVEEYPIAELFQMPHD